LEEEVEDRLGDLEPEGVKVLTFRAVQRVLETATAEGPLVLVCEDLHWADASSLELLEQVLALTDRCSLVIICALRPYREHACWGIKDAATHLYHHRHRDVWLQPLSAADSEELVANLLEVEALPHPLRMRILNHAEGNPFYVEEMIRSLIDSNVVVYSEMADQWQATRKVEDIAIPDTLQGVLMARIDRLQEDARRVLQMASVIGRIFPYRVLAAFAQQRGELRTHLLTLQREEMIRERARVPELEYIFKHHLTQQAAYNGLLRRERRRFHRQVAEAMEALFPDRMEEQLGLLAHHWEDAGERERAIEYLRRAGEQAAAQFANEESVGYFTRALDLTPEENLAGRYDLLLARQEVYRWQGAPEVQRQDLVALQELVEVLDDDRRRMEVALLQANCASMLSDYPAAIAAARLTIRLAQAMGDVYSEAMGYNEWGRALMLQANCSAARARLERALSLARDAGLRRVESSTLNTLGLLLLFYQGDYAGARACLEHNRRVCREMGDRRGESRTGLYLGFTALGLGEYDEARAYYEHTVAVFREIGNRWSEGVAHWLSGRVYHCLGDYDRARVHYGDYLRNCREVGDRRGVGVALHQLSLLSHDMADDKAAQEYAERALEMIQAQGDRLNQGTASLCLGHALVGLARLDEAADAYSQALTSLRESGRPSMDPLAGLARVCLARGDLSQAKAYVEEILQCPQGAGASSVLPAEDASRVYLTCYRVLEANADARAQDVLEEGYRHLQEHAAKISDEEERRSFLENVAANREIVEKYAARQ